MYLSNDNSSRITRQLFLKLLPMQILSILVGAANVSVDNAITSKFLGTDAMAAIGLFCPAVEILGLAYVITVGGTILCSRYIGRGEKATVEKIFPMCLTFLGGCAISLAIVCFLFASEEAVLLGAVGDSRYLLTEYIRGYSFGLPGQVLIGMMMQFLPFNGDSKRVYRGIALNITLNVIGDILLVPCLGMGIWGMGFATSISNLLSAGYLLAGFTNKEKIVYFRICSIEFSKIAEMAVLGIPAITFAVGCTIKTYAINNLLVSYGGIPAMAAMSVQGNVACIIGAIPCGAANVMIMLSSMYYGEEDEEALKNLLKNALAVTCGISAICVAVLFVGAGSISSFYYPASDPAWGITYSMLHIFPIFLIFNSVLWILLKLYQGYGDTKLINFIMIFENLVVVLFSVMFIDKIGTDAVWLSYPVSNILCICVIAISIFKLQGRLPVNFKEWLNLKGNFGVNPEDKMSITIVSIEETMELSKQVMKFCQSKGLNEHQCYAAGLCLEEMAVNVIQHGFDKKKNNAIDVRLIYKNSELFLILRDNCREFNPNKYWEQFKANKEGEGIGLRLVKGMSKEMTYQSSLGLNILTIKI